jgi:6-phosphogluconate dehydrogenase
MKLGFIGLGKMGNRMVSKLLEEGHEVVVWNRTEEKVSSIKDQVSSYPYKDNLKTSKSTKDLVSQLEKPRVVWLMLPAGEATEGILEEISKYVRDGDIVIDGGNAHFSDTQKRYETFKGKGIRFLGIGVSGGIVARAAGYPMMVGGDKSAYEEIKPVLDSLAKPAGGHEYFGEGGAGHFVKMVHNGIEYGYMQAIGEGFGVMEKSPYDLDLLSVAKLYQKGTLVSGFMMERAIESLEKDPQLDKLEGVIAASGEGEWTIDQAKKTNVPVDVIETSFKFRQKSQTDPKISSSFAARMVAALRNAFGGHEVKNKS